MSRCRSFSLRKKYLLGFFVLSFLIAAIPVTATEFASLPGFKYSYDPMSRTVTPVSPFSPTIPVAPPTYIPGESGSGGFNTPGTFLTPGSFAYAAGFSNSNSNFNSGFSESSSFISPAGNSYQDEEFRSALIASLSTLHPLVDEVRQAGIARNYDVLLTSAMQLKSEAESQHNSLDEYQVSPLWVFVQSNYLQALDDLELAADNIVLGAQAHFNGDEVLSETYLRAAYSDFQIAIARIEAMRP